MGQAQAAPARQEPEFHTDLPVGEVLRRARVHYGQSLKDVEKNIRIRASQIEAIETGNYENLPGRVYAIGFVRSYAEYLGLDGGQVVSLFKAQSMNANVRPEFHFPAPASESKLPSRWVLIGSLAATVLLVMFWWSTTEHSREIVKNVPAVPLELREKAGIPELMDESGEVQSDVDLAAADEVGAEPVTAALTQGAPDSTASAETESVAVPASGSLEGSVVAAKPAAEVSGEDSAALPQTPAKQPVTNGAENGITLNIVENSWVEIRDQSGKTIVSKVLKVGDQYFVPNRPDLQMSLGNAGGVEVVIDGKTMPPLGARGEVRRDISLDVDALRAHGAEPQAGNAKPFATTSSPASSEAAQENPPLENPAQ